MRLSDVSTPPSVSSSDRIRHEDALVYPEPSIGEHRLPDLIVRKSIIAELHLITGSRILHWHRSVRCH